MNIPVDLLAKNLKQLSTKEREQVYFDLHGVSDAIHETPDFLTEKLREFQERLDAKPDTPAYDLAHRKDASHVMSRVFRLKYLRADSYEADKAVDRMEGFLTIRIKLFGEDKVTGPITLDDLDEDDLKLAESGWVHRLPLRDRAGRLVTCMVPSLRGDASLESRVRSLGIALLRVFNTSLHISCLNHSKNGWFILLKQSQRTKKIRKAEVLQSFFTLAQGKYRSSWKPRNLMP